MCKFRNENCFILENRYDFIGSLATMTVLELIIRWLGLMKYGQNHYGQKKVSVSIRGFVTIRSLTQVAFRNIKFAKSLCWDLLFYVELGGSAVGVDYNVNALL